MSTAPDAGPPARIHPLAHRLTHREDGASAVEYGLLIALIALVIIAAVTILGSNLNDTYSEIATQI